MLQQLEEIKSNALQQFEGIDNPKGLEAWRIHFLGKKSPLTDILRSLAALPLADRKAVGAHANQIKNLLEDHLKQKRQALRETQPATHTKKEAIDTTLPGRHLPTGHLHPITQHPLPLCLPAPGK